jgi:DNA-binding transcriptional regulator YiaG/Pyruvate/2-oxoacid:ferredoxin oxidoreductase delta subunit
MPYTIPDSCFQCGACQPQCPTGAIQNNGEQYEIVPELCNGCQGYYAEPQCVIACPISSPLPKQAKKGRYKANPRTATSPNLFPNGKNNPFASSMAIWEACNLLTSAAILPWKTDEDGKFYYERPVKQGRGSIAFYLTEDLESEFPEALNREAALEAIDKIDIRSACVHAIFAAYSTTLDRPWEQEFVISDRQIEKYLGFDKRKDLSKAAKLTLIKDIVQQPCKLATTIDWPRQGKVSNFSLPQSRLWHLREIQHHFQEDPSGDKHLIGLTFRVQAGIWARYFLNKQGCKDRTAFYQYGTLPKFLLNAISSIWQQHEGAARIMLWLLFKTKMGKEQRITVPTLMNVAYGETKVTQATSQREIRKRLLRTFESDLEILDRYGLKPVFDPVTYAVEIQPLWAKLAEVPDDAEAALEFWTNDGNRDRSLTDSGPRDKWNLLMKARILRFDLPPEWDRQLTQWETKKQRRQTQKTKSKSPTHLSAQEIVKARKHRGISQRDLAQMMGKSQSWIRDLENGRLSIKRDDENRLQKILVVPGVNIDTCS